MEYSRPAACRPLTAFYAERMGIFETIAARLIRYNTHFLSLSDLQGEDERCDPFEQLLENEQGTPVE